MMTSLVYMNLKKESYKKNASNEAFFIYALCESK